MTQPLLNFDPWLARSSFALAPLLSVLKTLLTSSVLLIIKTGLFGNLGSLTSPAAALQTSMLQQQQLLQTLQQAASVQKESEKAEAKEPATISEVDSN